MRMVTMRGPGDIDLHKVNDIEAGLIFLNMVGRLYPNIKFGQLSLLADSGPEKMGYLGFLPDWVGSGVSQSEDLVGGVLKTAGSDFGSALRLLTDSKVISGASKLAAGYATMGASAVLDSSGNPVDSGFSVSGIMQWLAGLGSSFKNQAASAAPSSGGSMLGISTPLVIGGVVLVGLMFFVRRK